VGDGDLSANQVQVRVAHLGLDRTTNTPVVILQEQEGERVLPASGFGAAEDEPP